MDKVKAKKAHEEEILVFRGKGKNTNLREGERGGIWFLYQHIKPWKNLGNK
jgi:hypothetical protein